MFKKVGISIFLLYYLTFMVLPNLPLVQYYYYQVKHNNNEQILTNSNNQILVGDICFLKALIDRTNESSDNKKDEAPPEPNNMGTNLVYLVTRSLFINNINCITNVSFRRNSELLTFRYLQIPSPPPKLL